LLTLRGGQGLLYTGELGGELIFPPTNWRGDFLSTKEIWEIILKNPTSEKLLQEKASRGKKRRGILGTNFRECNKLEKFVS